MTDLEQQVLSFVARKTSARAHRISLDIDIVRELGGHGAERTKRLLRGRTLEDEKARGCSPEPPELFEIISVACGDREASRPAGKRDQRIVLKLPHVGQDLSADATASRHLPFGRT